MAIRDGRLYARELARRGYSYVYGMRGWKTTQANLTEKRRQYASRRNLIPCHDMGPNSLGFDCIGALCYIFSCEKVGIPMGGSSGMYYYATKNGKKGNSFMDKLSADGAKKEWSAKSIATLPKAFNVNKQIALFMPGHVGYYLGGGEAFECTTYKDGLCMITKLSERNWTHWAYIPDSWTMWADSYHCAKPAQEVKVVENNQFKVGDRVRVNSSAGEWYPGTKMPSWVPGQEFAVMQVLCKGEQMKKGGVPCVLLDRVNTWCAESNLEKVKV